MVELAFQLEIVFTGELAKNGTTIDPLHLLEETAPVLLDGEVRAHLHDLERFLKLTFSILLIDHFKQSR